MLIKRSLPLAALPGLSWDLTTSGAGQVRNPNNTRQREKSDWIVIKLLSTWPTLKSDPVSLLGIKKVAKSCWQSFQVAW